MEQTVYVDLYFLINFSMDFLCFFLLSKLLSVPLPFWRTLAASALGGLYADLALFLPLSALASLLLDMAVCVLMCAVALLRRGDGRHLPLYALVYVAISMVLGGAMTALFHLFNRLELPLDAIDEDDLSVWLFALLAIIGGFVTHACGRFFSKRGARRHARLSLTFSGRSCTVEALCDTGNLLREPTSGRPCIVVDTKALRGVIPADLLSAAAADAPLSPDLFERYAGRIRPLPAASATGTRMLLALRVDCVTVEEKTAPREVDALIVPSALGGTASALIPPELLL